MLRRCQLGECAAHHCLQALHHAKRCTALFYIALPDACIVVTEMRPLGQRHVFGRLECKGYSASLAAETPTLQIMLCSRSLQMRTRHCSSQLACCMPAGTLHTQALPRQVRPSQHTSRGRQLSSLAPRAHASMPQPWSSQVLCFQWCKAHGKLCAYSPAQVDAPSLSSCAPGERWAAGSNFQSTADSAQELDSAPQTVL